MYGSVWMRRKVISNKRKQQKQNDHWNGLVNAITDSDWPFRNHQQTGPDLPEDQSWAETTYISSVDRFSVDFTQCFVDRKDWTLHFRRKRPVLWDFFLRWKWICLPWVCFVVWLRSSTSHDRLIFRWSSVFRALKDKTFQLLRSKIDLLRKKTSHLEFRPKKLIRAQVV